VVYGYIQIDGNLGPLPGVLNELPVTLILTTEIDNTKKALFSSGQARMS
jgi:hypothetical protein